MHLRSTLPVHTAAMAAADPPAPIEHIVGERVHAQALHVMNMMQLCSLASSTSAHMKEQLELEVEEHRRIADRCDTRTASGRVVTVGDLPRRSARGPQLVLRVGGSNQTHPVVLTVLVPSTVSVKTTPFDARHIILLCRCSVDDTDHGDPDMVP